MGSGCLEIRLKGNGAERKMDFIVIKVIVALPVLHDRTEGVKQHSSFLLFFFFFSFDCIILFCGRVYCSYDT